MSLCVLVTRMCCAKTAEQIEMPFGGLTQVRLRNHVLESSRDCPTRRDNFKGLSGPLKSAGSLCCGICSKRDHSILNNGMTARLPQPTAMFPTGRCHITLSLVKNPPLCDAAFRSLTTCYIILFALLLITQTDCHSFYCMSVS